MSYIFKTLGGFVLAMVLVFAGMFGWYSLFFKQSPGIPDVLIRAKSELLTKTQGSEIELANYLDQFSMPLIITENNMVLSSNLGESLHERNTNASAALKETGRFSKWTLSSQVALYYQTPSGIFESVLLFPLVFSVLLGLLFSLFVYLNARRIASMEDTLREMRDEIDLHISDEELDALKERLAFLQTSLKEAHRLKGSLEDKNQILKAQIERLETRIQQAPAAQSGAPLPHKLYDQIQILKEKQQLLQQEKLTLKSQHQFLKKELLSVQTDKDHLGAELKEKKQALAKLTQKDTAQAQVIDRLKKRIDELEQVSQQIYEAYQLIQDLQTERQKLKSSEQHWKHEKNKLIQVLNDKDAEIDEHSQKLEKAIEQLRKLSTAYKQKVELVQALPEDIHQVKSNFEDLIAQKDTYEKQNAKLQLDLVDKQSEIQRLRRELGNRQTRNQTLELHLQQLEKDFKTLHRELHLLEDALLDKLVDLERLQLNYGKDKQLYFELTQERDLYKTQLQDSQTAYEKLKAEYASHLSDYEQLQAKMDEIDVLKHQFQVDQLKQSVQMLTAQKKDKDTALKQAHQNAVENKALIQSLQKNLVVKQEEIQSLHQEIERLGSMLKLMEKKLKNS